MTYDILIQCNEISIKGLDKIKDISETYRNQYKYENLSKEKAIDIINEAYDNFKNSEQYKNYKKSYYPTEWKEPCRAIIAPTNTLNSNNCINISDYIKARKKGGLSFKFTMFTKSTLNDRLDIYFNFLI